MKAAKSTTPRGERSTAKGDTAPPRKLLRSGTPGALKAPAVGMAAKVQAVKSPAPRGRISTAGGGTPRPLANFYMAVHRAHLRRRLWTWLAHERARGKVRAAAWGRRTDLEFIFHIFDDYNTIAPGDPRKSKCLRVILNRA